MSENWKTVRAELGATIRFHPDRTDDIDDARRRLRTARLADAIKATVDAAPPLTDAQRHQLAALLLGGDAA